DGEVKRTVGEVHRRHVGVGGLFYVMGDGADGVGQVSVAGSPVNAALIRVGPNLDGKHHLADDCHPDVVGLWDPFLKQVTAGGDSVIVHVVDVDGCGVYGFQFAVFGEHAATEGLVDDGTTEALSEPTRMVSAVSDDASGNAKP